MWQTTDHDLCMPVTIQIRNVPEGLRRRLKSCAATAGMSLSDYLLGELRRLAEQPTLADRPTFREFRARLERRHKLTPAVTAADLVRAARGPL
jgi:plasmid stability protein